MKSWNVSKIKAWVPTLSRLGIRALGGAILSASQIFGGYSPFALGFVAASGPRFDGLFALLGTVVGGTLFLDFSQRLRLVASAFLVFAASMAFYDAPFYKKPYTRPLLAAGLTAAVEFAYAFSGQPTGRDILCCLGAVGLAGISVIPYCRIFKGKTGKLDPLLKLFLAVTVLMAISDMTLFGFLSPARMALACLTLLYAAQEGMGAGAAVGFGVGLAIDLSAPAETLFCTASFALFGLIAGALDRHGRFLTGAIVLLANTCLLLPYGGEAAGAMLLENLIAIAVFCAIPRRGTRGKRLESREGSHGDRLREQLSEASAAFREVYEMLSPQKEEAEEDPAVIFDRSAEKVCRSCTLCTLCWKEEYVSTFNAFNDATPAMLQRGRAQSRDFPIHFSSRCIHFADLMASINLELSAYLLRSGYRRRILESERKTREQYARISDLFRSTAASMSRPAAAIGTVKQALLVGEALSPKAGESVSGDSAAHFTLDSGLTYLLLSDGAGSGEAARRESALALRLLTHFLRSGVDVSAALKTVSDAFSLKGSQGGSFATIDLVEVDGRTGEAAFYKYGAAPSYIKRGIQIQRVTGACLPAGLQAEGTPPDALRTTVDEESFIVLISDGVADLLSDEWLQNLLAGWQGQDPQALANRILAEAHSRGRDEDDCAVVAARLHSGEDQVKMV